MSKTITIPDFLWERIQTLSKQRFVNQPDCPVETKDLDDPRTLEIYNVGESDGEIGLACDIMRLLE